MKRLRISRLEAAQRQIDQAIRLHFQRGDCISIHTLAAAGLQILRDIAKQKGLPTFGQELLGLVRPELRKRVWNKIREAEGFFKHADQGPVDLEIEFSPLLTKYFLFEAVELFRAIASRSFPAASGFWVWFFIGNQDLAMPDVRQRAKEAVKGLDPDNYEDFIEFIARLERDEELTQRLVRLPRAAPLL